MSLLQKHPKFKWLIATGDLLGTALSLVTTFAWVYEGSFQLPTILSVLVLTIIPVCHVLVFQILDLYKMQTIVDHKLSFLQLLKGVAFFGFIAFGVQTVALSEATFAAPVYSILLLAYLILIRNIILYFFQHTRVISDRVVMVGAGAKAKALHNSFTSKLRTHETIGFLDDHLPKGTLVNNLPVLGDISQSHVIARSMKVDYFVMAIDNVSANDFHRIVRYFTQHNLTLYICSSYLKAVQQAVSADTLGEHKLIRIGKSSPSPLMAFSKRAFDMIVSLMLIIILSPLLLFISLAVALTSKGPVIYKQVRIGKQGKPFTFYKFRSMRLNSDADKSRDEQVIDFIRGGNDGAINTKIVNKSRITGIGKFIRKTSLDELPQLVNVLIGNMSLVGPRPCLPVEWNAYDDWQRLRLNTIPGCTGIWQTKGRSKVNFEQTVLLDIYYNCNVSLWLDFKIMLNTIPVMVFSKGGE